jgi:hypothetical protein
MSWVSVAVIGVSWMLAGFVAAMLFGKLIRKGNPDRCDGAGEDYSPTVTIVHPHDRTA